MGERILVIGAGPYGLSAAAHAMRRGFEVTVVGKPMGFWREHMPEGMLLRSGVDWHLDADAELTLERHLTAQGVDPAQAEPLPLRAFLDYAQWFREQAGVRVRDARVAALHRDGDGFRAELEEGEPLRADVVIAAPGVGYFANVPDHPVAALPAERWAHTCNLVDFRRLAGRRILIVGGRQSAFEWAALLGEAGAAALHLSYRHDTPRFAPSDWSWVDALVAQSEQTRGWFRQLDAAARDDINRRFWAEGRLKLEPWLAPRLEKIGAQMHPRTRVVGCTVDGDEIRADLDDGTALRCDFAVLATGYRVDVARVPYLAPVVEQIAGDEAWPRLDEWMQTPLRGLFLPGFTATRDFGPFFGFVRGCPTASRIMLAKIAQNGA